MSDSKLYKAISMWETILPSECLILDTVKLSQYQICTTGAIYNTPCVLCPTSIIELANCLKIANELEIKVFPISAGQNYGYNSSTPMDDDTVVIDLKKLDSILEFNIEFGYVIIEPGVTFAKLYQFLANHKSTYIMSGFTGSPNASFVGNVLDRGTGRGRYGNRHLCVQIKEVMLASGELIDIRNKYNYEDKTVNLRYSSVGADLETLFYQSNLAIITKMIVYLEPIPDQMLLTSISFNSNIKLYSLIDTLKLLNARRIIEPSYTINNDVRMLIKDGRYKQTDTDNLHKLNEVLDSFHEITDHKFKQWNCSFIIHCYSHDDLLLRKQSIINELAWLEADMVFDNINRHDSIKLIEKSIQSPELLTPLDKKFLYNLGYTDCLDQKTLYWATSGEVNILSNPINSGCGLIFFSPKIPLNASHLAKALEILGSTSSKYSIETPITLQVKTNELICMVLPILFNVSDDNSKLLALNYYHELLDKFNAAGYLPCRYPSITMEEIFNKDNRLSELMRSIKLLFDPSQIIGHRKYQF